MIYTAEAILDKSIKLSSTYCKRREVEELENLKKTISKKINGVIEEQLKVLKHYLRRYGYRLEDMIDEDIGLEAMNLINYKALGHARRCGE
ncbi:MAG: hypothetical protein QXR62_05310 [Candidatus Bathyarchaeia archaeon]